ncbi:L-selectin-like [Nematolebias whitei]|uniref:L-selectin-like n=1 Tax=Nematolebias whitei TaxID=451745 RepID=UPI0018972F9D|nr:L-selectin-like [Nematolebias whitei]
MQWSLILLFLMGQCCFTICQLYQYHFVEENKNWTEAQQYCREIYSDLATVSNMTDMKRILNISAENTEAWIGLYEQTGVNRTWHSDQVILIKENKTWEEALYYCRDHHHDLVTITNLDEQRWVQEKAKKASTPFVWMGLRYTCTLDFWFWVSDEVVSYKNWVSDGLMDDCDMSAVWLQAL